MNNIKYYLIKFFVSLGIMCTIALLLGVICAFIEDIFKIDTTRFIYFTMGYLGCLIFNWRWFINAERKEEKR